MPAIYEIAPRLTHSYVGSWKHLDKYGHPMPVKVLPGKQVTAYELKLMRYKQNGMRLRGDAKLNVNIDPSEGTSWINWVEAPKGVDDKSFKSAMYGTFDVQGCGHSFDCCGCVSRSISLKKVRGRRWIMTTTLSRNC